MIILLASGIGFDSLRRMPRHRKNDPAAATTSVVEQFARKLGETLERFITARIAKEIARTERDVSRRGRRGRPRRRRARTLCYYPGCKNIAAPRFGMFCAALHKNLPDSEKAKYRAAHARAQAKKASESKGRPKAKIAK
jgi:hypothetical protein